MNNVKFDYPNALINFIYMDCLSYSSVKVFADEFKSKHNKLNCQILNRFSYKKEFLTLDGFNASVQFNHLSQIYLMDQLFDVLKKTKYSRIVSVGSNAHRNVGEMAPCFYDMNIEKREFHKVQSANETILYRHLFMRALASFIEIRNYEIASVSCTVNDFANCQVDFGYRLGWCKSFGQGEQNLLYCVTCPWDVLRNGRFYDGCRQRNLSDKGENEGNCMKCWDFSLEHLSSMVDIQEFDLRYRVQDQSKVEFASYLDDRENKAYNDIMK